MSEELTYDFSMATKKLESEMVALEEHLKRLQVMVNEYGSIPEEQGRISYFKEKIKAVSEYENIQNQMLKLGENCLEISDELMKKSSELILGNKDEMVPRFGPETTKKIITFSQKSGDLNSQLKAFLHSSETVRFIASIKQVEHAIHQEEVITTKKQREMMQKINEAQLLSNKVVELVPTTTSYKDSVFLNEDYPQRINDAAVRVFKNEIDEASVEVNQLKQYERGVGAATRLIQTLRTNKNTEALSGLRVIMENIYKRPENETFRLLKTSNKVFKTLIDTHPVVKQILYAIGFQPKMVVVDEASNTASMEVLAFKLEEPNVETEFEKWSEFYETIKTVCLLLSSTM